VTPVRSQEIGEAFAPDEVIVQITRCHTTSRSYDAIRVHIGGAWFSRDLLSAGDIRQAKCLAEQVQGQFWVSPELQTRVDAALTEVQS